MSEDLIRRSDAIKAMEKLIEAEGTMDYTEWDFPTSYKQERINQTEACIDQIRYIPAVEPKRGEWKVRGNPKRNLWECSLCRCTIYSESESDRNEFHKWCGRCGARMKGADDNFCSYGERR